MTTSLPARQAIRGPDIRVLTEVEGVELDRCEQTIRDGLDTFVKVGTALATIREKKLYRTSHATFEAYCISVWGFSDRRARQLIVGAEVGTIVPVANEGQARELVGLDRDAAAEVWRIADERTEGKPTAAALREAKESLATGDAGTCTAPATAGQASSEIPPGDGADQFVVIPATADEAVAKLKVLGEEQAAAEALAADIRQSLHKLLPDYDTLIAYALVKGLDRAWIAGNIAALLYRLSPTDRPAFKSVFEPRIEFVLNQGAAFTEELAGANIVAPGDRGDPLSDEDVRDLADALSGGGV